MHILHETLQEKGALVPNRLRSRHAGKKRATRGSIGASVEGSLDALSAPDLGKEFSTQIESGHSNLVANLADVDYSSSAGLRVLLTAVKETRQNGGDLRLAAVQANVNKVLTLAGLSSAIEQFPDVEAAVSSFEAAS